jgi:hypothetical protein
MSAQTTKTQAQAIISPITLSFTKSSPSGSSLTTLRATTMDLPSALTDLAQENIWWKQLLVKALTTLYQLHRNSVRPTEIPAQLIISQRMGSFMKRILSGNSLIIKMEIMKDQLQALIDLVQENTLWKRLLVKAPTILFQPLRNSILLTKTQAQLTTNQMMRSLMKETLTGSSHSMSRAIMMAHQLILTFSVQVNMSWIHILERALTIRLEWKDKEAPDLIIPALQLTILISIK